MTWANHYRRRDALDAVLHDARRDPSAPLIVDPDVFSSLDELLLALQHRWTNKLTARMETAALDGPVDEERVTAELAADEPVLRAVLDAHLPLDSYRAVGMTP
ncbi:hypothetical protein BBK82_02665 [Lentzea guizhouensis]|uniref:Uncharacterized protein n=1 Tax=Lentzea guizhouensis TaxID=1586287 RepID=A0A1B2HBN3_9PSEU|nr:hypothetical protein [Lentzea guizhouensis]ANZ35135.1 hypothetical protein BBK82_02665 [Lentzea guizhouensis]